ncbi:hypothetical protein SLEP1_g38981 [Rubroshorea leprosula]|uniref:Uncharacterized protein n=1 Tax=Rubroshorea leprosula TaxID=152421 RepID=A0AAV5KZ44_9ROSI|nr:hypothetical protein SLEP1_g38981 [Rubroshorea leprosula]
MSLRRMHTCPLSAKGHLARAQPHDKYPSNGLMARFICVIG